jgi:hypothetical protein
MFIFALILALVLVLGGSAFLHRRMSKQIELRFESLRAEIANARVQAEAVAAIHAELAGAAVMPRTGGWAASADFLALIADIVHRRDVQTVVECSSGLSTVVLAACMRNRGRGHVFSLEHEAQFAEKTRELLRRFCLQDWASVIEAPLVAYERDDWRGSWYGLQGLPSDLRADLVVVDGPPYNTSQLARWPALPALESRLADKVVFALDDADRAEEAEIVRRWLSSGAGLSVEPYSATCEKGAAVLVRDTPVN